jgi:hypothetical protein
VAEHTRELSWTLLTTQETMDRVRRTLARQARQKRAQGDDALVMAAMQSTPTISLKFRVEEDEKRALEESDVGGPADDGVVAPSPPGGPLAR